MPQAFSRGMSLTSSIRRIRFYAQELWRAIAHGNIMDYKRSAAPLKAFIALGNFSDYKESIMI